MRHALIASIVVFGLCACRPSLRLRLGCMGMPAFAVHIRDTVVLMPPYCIDDAQLVRAVDALAHAIGEVCR